MAPLFAFLMASFFAVTSLGNTLKSEQAVVGHDDRSEKVAGMLKDFLMDKPKTPSNDLMGKPKTPSNDLMGKPKTPSFWARMAAGLKNASKKKDREMENDVDVHGTQASEWKYEKHETGNDLETIVDKDEHFNNLGSSDDLTTTEEEVPEPFEGLKFNELVEKLNKAHVDDEEVAGTVHQAPVKAHQ